MKDCTYYGDAVWYLCDDLAVEGKYGASCGWLESPYNAFDDPCCC